METIGPGEFGRITGLSAKAIRIYEDRGLLAPSAKDVGSGYRRYTTADVNRAGRIALLRRGGISLSEIGRFLADPTLSMIDSWLRDVDSERNERRNALNALARALGLGSPTYEEDVMAVTIRSVTSLDELGDVFDAAGAQFDAPIDRSDDTRFGDLRAAFDAGERDLLLVAETDGAFAGAALGFSGRPSATLRMLATDSQYRRRGLGRSLLRAFESAVERAGIESVALGADEQAGFYVRHGYQTMLLLQWVYAGDAHAREREELLAGPLRDSTTFDSTFNGVPQLFAILGEPDPSIRSRVSDIAIGAHVGYCMTKKVRRVEASPA